MNACKGKERWLICCALVFVLSVSGGLGAGTALAADSAACTDCHTEQQSAKLVHSPALEGMCTSCHEPTPKHLEEGGPGGMVTDRTAAACYQCHEEVDKGKNIHAALEMDDCVQCHNPHGSDNEKLLLLPKNRLCLECHDPVPAEAAQGSEHGAVTDAQGCVNCHDPHSSDQAALLLRPQRALCLGCHNKEIAVKEGNRTGRVMNIQQRLDMPSVHEPATADDGCTSCHAPHGSQYKKLLVAAFPEKIYNRYLPGDGTTGNTYELCFNCHDQAMLNQTIGAGDTGFRNDTVRGGAVVRENLHWLHVVDAVGWHDKKWGRSCNICHDPHGTPQPHLVRAWWTMRSYQPILKFESRPNGGECLRSCHTPKSYQRVD
jgi:predicted CXXCH cytochrome family protein